MCSAAKNTFKTRAKVKHTTIVKGEQYTARLMAIIRELIQIIAHQIQSIVTPRDRKLLATATSRFYHIFGFSQGCFYLFFVLHFE